MATRPDPTGPVIEPQSPPETPGVERPLEAPAHDTPEIVQPGPDTDVPDPHIPETPPPL